MYIYVVEREVQVDEMGVVGQCLAPLFSEYCFWWGFYVVLVEVF